jgi:hypothetical protein
MALHSSNMRIFIASIAAVAIQPAVFLLRIAPAYFASPTPFHGLGLVLAAVVAVAAVAVLLLGIPIFLLLRKHGHVKWTSLATAGLCIGMLPAALLWPRKLEGYSSGQNWHGRYVDTYINGMPTAYAWLTYAESVLYFGVHGLIGALTFYVVWRRMGRAADVS